MAFPLSQGSTPESGIIPADEWTLILTSVSIGKITNEYPANQEVWLTYIKLSDVPPVEFDDPSTKWRLKDDTAEFQNSESRSNVYAYAKGKIATIGVQA